MQERRADYYDRRPTDLKRLRDMENWDIAKEDTDIRGWALVDRDENDMGEVQDFLVDPETHEAVFTVVKYGGALGMGGKHTLVPLNQIHLDRDKHRVYYEGTADSIHNAPEYTEDTHEYGPYYDYWSGMRAPETGRPEYEERERAMGRETARHEAIEREEVISETEEHLTAHKTEQEIGEVEVRKDVIIHEETVHEPVKRTRVHVMRRAVEGRELRPGEHVLREGETLEIPVIEEHLDVEKRSMVTGEVIIRLESYTEDETVTGQVRSEHVAVEPHGDIELEEEEEERTRHTGY